MQRAANAYFQTQVSTTSQGEVVIMLYDGAINFLNQAKEGIAKGDMAAKGIAISKTLDILNELASSLNMDKGGALAGNLNGLYLFCTGHLARANLKKDPDMIDEVINILAGLRGAYAQIADMPEARAAAREAADCLSQVSNRVSRPAGQSAGFAAPGAGARMRNSLYAKSAGPVAEQARPQEVETPAPASFPSGSPVSCAEAAPGEGRETPPESGFAALPGFARRPGGADLYRKFNGR